MNRNFKTEHLILTTLFMGAFTQSAQADFFLHPWENYSIKPDEVRFQFKEIYFETRSNFNFQGKRVIFSNSQSYRRIQSDLSLDYSFSSRVQVYGRSSWVYIPTEKAFGFADQSLGMSLKVYEGKSISLTSQFRIDIPAYPTAASDNFGDGSIDLTGGGFATLPLASLASFKLELLMGAGYTYRTHFYSAALPWSVSFKLTSSNDRFYVQLFSQGFLSLKNDPHSFDPSLFRSNLGSGNSLFTGAMNPSVIQLSGLLSYRFSSTSEIYIATTQTLWGQMTPNGFDIGIGYQLRLDASSHPQVEVNSTQGVQFSPEKIEAKVLKSNEKIGLIKINKGSQDGIKVGDEFHLFAHRNNTEPMIRAKVTHIRPQEAVLEIIKYFHETLIEENWSALKIN